MNPTNTPQLRLPMQARPVHRTGSHRGAIGGAGIEADGFWDDPFGAIGAALESAVDYVAHHPYMLAPLFLL